jgi:hypothetical protein
VKTRRNLEENSKEGYGSERVVLPMTLMTPIPMYNNKNLYNKYLKILNAKINICKNSTHKT